MRDKYFVESIVNNNAKHILNLNTEEEVKIWITSIVYAAISYARHSTQKQ